MREINELWLLGTGCLQFRFRFLDTSIENGSFEDFIQQIDYRYWDLVEFPRIVIATPWDFVQVFILKGLKLTVVTSSERRGLRKPIRRV